MKLSKAMLKGFAMAGERQCFGVDFDGDPLKPIAVCAVGAMNLGLNNDANNFANTYAGGEAFRVATGVFISQANDYGMSIPDIAGILASEGY